MTARHQIRVGGRLGRGRTPIDATPAPSLGEMLQAARERKGVDLHRAERDTKIRLKHLAALESDDYAELPGNVYARGFLRNYALYLGLDPDEVLVKWRNEQDMRNAAQQDAILAPPQPIAEPKGSLRFTRAVFAVALLMVVIVAFVGYVGLQLVRFSQVPAVALDGSPRRDLAADAQSVHLTGSSTAGFTIVVSGSGNFLKSVQAGDDTKWAIDLPVTKGQNDFTILARDPSTSKESPPVNVIVTVPVPASPTPIVTATIGPVATSSAGVPLQAAQLALTEPVDGAQVNTGTIKVSGTTDAAGVTVTAVFVGPALQAAPSPAPGASAAPPPPGGPAVPDPVQVNASSGAFSISLALPVGRWTITVTTNATDTLASAIQSVTVDVSYSGMVLMVEARTGSAWIQVWVDGAAVQTGKTFRKGETQTFTAKQTIVIHTGNAGATAYTLNGVDIGIPGSAGAVETWQFDKGRSQPRRIG
jgi:cytoskeletal protein RodZ